MGILKGLTSADSRARYVPAGGVLVKTLAAIMALTEKFAAYRFVKKSAELVSPLIFVAFRFVNPLPLPVKLPEKFTALAPLVTTLAGNCASGTVPVNCVAETDPLRLVALVAVMA